MREKNSNIDAVVKVLELALKVCYCFPFILFFLEVLGMQTLNLSCFKGLYLIVAEDIKSDALATPILNMLHAGIKVSFFF